MHYWILGKVSSYRYLYSTFYYAKLLSSFPIYNLTKMFLYDICNQGLKYVKTEDIHYYICKICNRVGLPDCINQKYDTSLIILGRMSRTRFIIMPTQGEGRPCPTELTQQKTCPVTPCYSWVLGNWSACKLEVSHAIMKSAFSIYPETIAWLSLLVDGIYFTEL